MKLLLSIAAILAWFFGVMLIAIPDRFYEPTGIVLTPMLATLAQAHGATLIGLGTINWLALKADRQGLIAVLAGNLVVQVLSLLVVFRAMQLGAGAAVAPGVVIHIVLGGLFLFFLIRARSAER
jgi:hypothetical protein